MSGGKMSERDPKVDRNWLIEWFAGRLNFFNPTIQIDRLSLTLHILI